ncbi:MAG: dipeptidase [Candidatus Bathyarchaeia archaeon]
MPKYYKTDCIETPDEYQVVDLELTADQKERAREIHEDAISINTLTGCHGWPSRWKSFSRSRAYNLIEKGLEGGCTANSLTLGGADIGELALQISEWDDIMSSIPEKAKKILSAKDIEEAKEEGKAGYIINTQNTTPLDGELSTINLLHKLGLRIMQLTYQKAELVGDGCGSRRADEAGLTDYGLSVLERMNDLNIVVDLSHVGHATAMEAVETSKQPPAFTHTNCHGTYGFEFMRGKSDEELHAVAERGGVVGMTCIARFIREEGDLEGSTINHYLDHIDYAVDLIGVDHVGIGLDINEGLTPEDYYGVHYMNFEARFQADPTSHTRRKHPYEHYYVFGLESIGKAPYITEGLVSRGYSDQEILKILGGNWLDYFRGVWGK